MSRLNLIAAALLFSLPAAIPSLGQDLPDLDLSTLDLSEPPLPEPGLPGPFMPEEPMPEIILLDPVDIIGTWHGIDPSAGSFSAWEVIYRDDGTYQVQVLRRDFDLPHGEDPDIEEVTDGSWKITSNGCLEFDDGDMLFEPIAEDQNKIVYTASFPGELNSKPWIVHEFRGSAPAAILQLAPYIPQNQGEPTAEEVQLMNLRHILLGCSVYAVDNGGQFPARIDAIIANIGADTLDKMKHFTDPDSGKQSSWTLLPGRKIADPHGTVLIHSPKFGDGRRIVGFIDNSAAILSENDFAARMSKQQK